MDIRKSKGFVEEYDVHKLKDSICAAYESAGEKCEEILLNSATQNFYLYNMMSTSELRRQVEEWLMSVNKKVAKTYIEKYNDSKDVKKKEDFIRSYIEASNAATGSKFDSNANVSNKNIVTLGQELYKENNIKQNRYILTNKITRLYSGKLANQYMQDLDNHILYKHDETGTPGYPYCVAITMYPFLVDGLKKLGGVSTAPTDAKSFCGEFVNLVYSVSSQFLGACMYKDQVINFVENGVSKRYKIKDFVNKYLSCDTIKFENYQGEWEYAKLPDNIRVLEDGKVVDVLKVYRRKYNSDIYKITTKDGYVAYTSEDHVFKQLIQGRELEVKAKQLKVNDTVFMNKDYSSVLDFNSTDFKKGWMVGMLCGDGCLTKKNVVELSVNYEQEYLGDIFNDYCEEIYGYKLNKNNSNKCFCFSKMCADFKNKITEDIVGDTAYDKHINIEDKSLNYIAGWLDGLFCSDGSYSESRGITIALTNKALAENIRDAVMYFGLPYKNLTVVKARGNRKESYQQYIPARILKYLNHVHKKCLKRGCRNITDVSREVYYYGYNAFQGRHESNKRMLVSNSKQSIKYNTDVISSIEKFKNDDEYVYEIETSTHWYNCGGFITHNCATPEFLMYLDYFLRKDYGDDYIHKLNLIVDYTVKKRSIEQVIENYFQQVVHSMNMPAGNRGYQTVFWNISYFDKFYFDGVFGEFLFPDGSKPRWDTLSWLQKKFMKWFNQERTKYVLTFPVETMALLTDGGNGYMDEEYADFTSEMWSEGHSFFCYLSDSPDSLSSCCRLRNSLKDLEEEDTDHNFTTHQYSMGTASVSTGSKSVMTINLPRLVQNATNRYYHEVEGKDIPKGVQMPLDAFKDKTLLYQYIREDVSDMVERVHKYQTAFNETIKDFLKANMLDVYNAGFIDIKKQYLTVGVNGITDAAEFFNIKVSNNDIYREFVNNILETINMVNRKNKTRDTMFNTEFVPAENLAAKNYKWDSKDGYWVSPNRNLYSSYFYNPEDTDLSVIDKMKLHGKEFVQYLDGGSAAHLNLNEHLSKEQYRALMCVAAEHGCNYFTYNIKNTCCEECGHIDKNTLEECPVCGSKKLSYLTRVIGYLKKTSSFSEPRQIEEHARFYAKNENNG